MQGSQAIIHAGDVGKPEILEDLKKIAPVFAVRGNVDTRPWASGLPLTEVVQFESISIYVLHNLQQLDLSPAASGFHVVISGHTHNPTSFFRDGVLYINPGSAGPKRFNLPISAARLQLDKSPLKPEFLTIA
jgi:putative phosphoesterase